MKVAGSKCRDACVEGASSCWRGTICLYTANGTVSTDRVNVYDVRELFLFGVLGEVVGIGAQVCASPAGRMYWP